MPKEKDKKYCDPSKITIRPIAKAIAKDMVVKYHYSHAWTSCRYALGVFHETDTENTFIDTDELIGVMIYGFPVGARAATSICEGLTKDNALELTRLFIHDGYGSNIESYALGQSFKWFRENDPKVKLLISYSDTEQEHLGKIYQATNWIYQGISSDIALMPNYGISLQKDPYKWIHSRTVFSKWGSSNLEHLKREIGKEGYKEFWRKREADKHRYIQILANNKRERRDLISRLKHPILDYPKDADAYQPNITHHYTYIPNEGNEKAFW